MHKRLQLILIALTFYSATFAQKATISGRVVDTLGQGLIGAIVVEKGTSNGAVVGENGKFSINVNDAKTASITASYSGYANSTVALGGKTTITITLREKTQ